MLNNPPDNSILLANMAAVRAMIPTAATAVPSTEMTGGAVGSAGVYSPANHSHPRLTSVTSGVLDNTGLSAAMSFTRSFAAQPGVVLTPITPGGSQPVILQVQSWVQDAGGNYTGCVVKGYRTVALPAVLASLTALLSFNIAGGSAAGVAFSLVAIQVS